MQMKSTISRILLAGVMALSFAGVSAADDLRTWTNKNTGSTIQAEATSINLSAKTVTLKTDKGKTVIMRFAMLSKEDLDWLKENKDDIGKSKSAKPSGAVGQSLVGKTHVLKDGKLVQQDGKVGAKYFILYYSASWCGPCCRNMPHSVKFYKSQVKDDKKVELILCSRDHTKENAEKWATANKMPWPILMPGTANEYASKFGPGGIPTAILVDKDGNKLGEAYGGEMEKLFEYIK